MSKITEHPSLSDRPRVAFVNAWLEWTRASAKRLAEAESFDAATPWLEELVVCHRVMATLIDATNNESAE